MIMNKNLINAMVHAFNFQSPALKVSMSQYPKDQQHNTCKVAVGYNKISLLISSAIHREYNARQPNIKHHHRRAI